MSPATRRAPAGSDRILVIKLGALGDFIHAFHAFAAIRAHHPGARIEILTTAPFAELAKAAPWFDDVHIDTRPPWWNLPELRRTTKLLRGFDLVYDLQTSRRSGRYFRIAGRPPWSGIAPGCAFPHDNPARDGMHTLERQREQLQRAGVAAFPHPARDWLTARGRLHGVAQPFALLVPGSSKGMQCPKRWPIASYARLAQDLQRRGITPVVVGSRTEGMLAAAIREVCAGSVDLTGQTTIFDLAALGSKAAVVVGNDTGPVHLAAFVSAPTIALFSAGSVYAQAAPRGPVGEWVSTLCEPKLADLAFDRVAAAVGSALERSGRPIVRSGVGGGEPEPQQQEEPAADRERDDGAGGGDRPFLDHRRHEQAHAQRSRLAP